jgi:Trypsin-like peptidase domain
VDVVAALLAALPSVPSLGGEGIADALWLAAAACPPPGAAPSIPAGLAGEPDSAGSGDDLASMPGPDPDLGLEPDLAGAPVPVPLRRVAVQPSRPTALLPGLDMARALRPFTRRWPRGGQTGLDLEATVRAFALTHDLLPVLRPMPERWFDLHVVVDGQPSMQHWLPTVALFADLLDGLGAFRTMRRWRLEHQAADCAVLDMQGRPAQPGRLKSAQARALVIVVSDFAGAGWSGPAVWKLVRSWAESTPTALVNVLPTRLWRYSTLGFPALPVKAGYPGTASPGLVATGSPLDMTPRSVSDLLVPVLALSSPSVARWASALMHADPRGCHAVPVPVGGAAPVEPPSARKPDGAGLATSFLVTASRNAIRLAAFCSVLQRIPTAVLDLLCAEFVPDARPEDLAEFLLSDMVRLDEDSMGAPAYTFRSGAQHVLSIRLPAVDAWRLYSRLIDRLTDTSDLPDFPEAVLYHAGQDAGLPQDARQYALASRNVLRALGWEPRTEVTVASPDPAGDHGDPRRARPAPAVSLLDTIGGSLVVLEDPASDRTGLGVLVAERTILTCAHVVAAMRGLRPRAAGQPPAGTVRIRWPRLVNSARVDAEVVGWDPPPGADLATLELQNAAPPGAIPAGLESHRPPEARRLQVFGRPRSRPAGLWTEVQVAASADGWLLTPADLLSPSLTEGFSGSPVYDPDSGLVVALVGATAGGSARESLAIPAARLIALLSGGPADEMPRNPFVLPTMELNPLQPLVPWKFPEHEDYYVPVSDTQTAYDAFRAAVNYDARALRDHGRLVVVLGSTGCGKTSLLNRCIGWMRAELMAAGVQPLVLECNDPVDLGRPMDRRERMNAVCQDVARLAARSLDLDWNFVTELRENESRPADLYELLGDILNRISHSRNAVLIILLPDTDLSEEVIAYAQMVQPRLIFCLTSTAVGRPIPWPARMRERTAAPPIALRVRPLAPHEITLFVNERLVRYYEGTFHDEAGVPKIGEDVMSELSGSPAAATIAGLVRFMVGIYEHIRSQPPPHPQITMQDVTRYLLATYVNRTAP